MFGLKEELIVQIYFWKESWKYISEDRRIFDSNICCWWMAI